MRSRNRTQFTQRQTPHTKYYARETVTCFWITICFKRCHTERIDSTAHPGGEAISTNFKFVHPVFAAVAATKCSARKLSKEEYVLTSVERILERFGVNKVSAIGYSRHVLVLPLYFKEFRRHP